MTAHPKSFKIICPACGQSCDFNTDLSASWFDVTCPSCQTACVLRIATVRSKNSRTVSTDVRSGTFRRRGSGFVDYADRVARSVIRELGRQRLFKVRVSEFPSGEEYVEFYSRGDEEFDMRAKDLVAFLYVGNEMWLVQNLTTNRFLNLRREFTGGFSGKPQSNQGTGITDIRPRSNPGLDEQGPVDAYAESVNSYVNNRATSFGFYGQLIWLGILVVTFFVLLLLFAAFIGC